MADAALSPSRAGDFMSCPLLFRYRTVDRLPESSSPDAVRGTLVHQVLEDIFDLPAADRTPAAAHALLEPTWTQLQERSAQAREVAATLDQPAWLDSAHDVLDRWFVLEDPTRLEPAEREAFVEATLANGLTLRGIIDRLDEAPDGALRIVDYKGLAVDTPLPTPAGWTTMGEVRVGDQLLGSDGGPTRVTLKSGIHHRPCYRVTFSDTSSVVCDNVHLWTVVLSRRQGTTRTTVNTEDLATLHEQLRTEGRPHSLWIESAGAVRTPDRDLALDPWLLGAWLGDGRSDTGALSVGREDLADMLTLIKEHWAGHVTVREDRTAHVVTLSRIPAQCPYGHEEWRPATERQYRRCRRQAEHAAMARSNVSLTTKLDEIGVRRDKHIPSDYLRAGTQQRIDLLRGLMDTDGWWNRVRRRAGFTTTSDALAAGVVELLRTLGVHPLHFRKDYANPVRPARTWHVIEFTPTWFNPFSLPRKASPAGCEVTELQRTLASRRVVTSVSRVETVPTQCVAVDAHDSLYLCGDGFVPTHNTSSAVSEGFEFKALFQLRIYALILWRARGVVPRMLQLVYLGTTSEMVRYEPDEADLLATERKIEALWTAIEEARRTGVFEPSRGKQCDWCSFKAHCPAWGGTLLPLPPPPSRWTLVRRSVRRRWRRLRRRLDRR